MVRTQLKKWNALGLVPMAYRAKWLLAISSALLVLRPVYVRAHEVGNVEPLLWVGYSAPFGNSGATTYTDVWAEGNLGFIGSLESGVAILDVSGPGNPIPLGTFVPAIPQQFYDVKANGDHGYFSSLNGGGTFVVDVQSPAAASTVAQIDSSMGGHDNVRNSVIRDDYLYQINDNSASIHVFDISTPSLPTYVRTVNTADSVGIYDATVIGDRMYASGLGGTAGEGAVYVYDISNQSIGPPVLLSQIPTGANSSSAWPTSNADYLAVTHRENGGALGIWDISNLSQPFLTTSADASDLGLTSLSSSEVVVYDDIVYTAWWQAGIQVIDLDNDIINNGVQLIGQLDTSTASPFAGFVGNQSVFPFLGHDKVLLGDTKLGFLIVSAEYVVPQTPNFGDFNGDGEYDGLDFLIWQRGFNLFFGALGSEGNADADGDVDNDDLLAWQSNYNTTPAFLAKSSGHIPEPASIMLVAATCLHYAILHRFR